jgi:hypothetical protein
MMVGWWQTVAEGLMIVLGKETRIEKDRQIYISNHSHSSAGDVSDGLC